MDRNYYLRFIWCLLIIPFALSCKEDEVIQTPIMKCEDATENWEVESSELPSNFNKNDIFFPTKEVGYVVGHAGLILKTIDGGISWIKINEIHFPDEITRLKLTEVYFINPNVGYIGGERKDFGTQEELLNGALLLRTTDGGVTWSKKYFSEIKEFSDIIFFDQFYGVALTALNAENQNLTRKILITYNGGEIWEEVNLPDIIVDSYKFEFKDSIIYFIAQDANHNAIMAISDDRGLHWTSKPLPEQECNRIIFINNQVGFVTCGLLFFKELVYKTEDQGTSWTKIDDSPLSNYSIVHFASKEHFIVLNSNYKWYQSGGEGHQVLVSFQVAETFDEGENWSSTEVERSCEFEGPSFSVDYKTFYIGGDKCSKFSLR